MNMTSGGQNIVLESPFDIAAAAAEAVEWLSHACDKGHHWTTEQQTGHPVCAWCGFCNGGCAR